MLRSCRNAAREMEELLFSVGGAERIVCILRIFRDRPVIKELGHVREAMQSPESLLKEKSYMVSKEEKMNKVILDSLSFFWGCSTVKQVCKLTMIRMCMILSWLH